MKTMKRLIFVLILCMAFIMPAIAQINSPQISVPEGAVVDTLVRTDTIVIKELITRTDVVHRTETVIRYEEELNSGQSLEKIISTSLVETPIVLDNSEREGGRYVWVPDSLQLKVDDILTGRVVYDWRQRRKEKAEFDPNEKVTFRGDTIPMVLKDRNLGRYDRGLFNFLFIPKGMWQVGITASYGEFSTKDLDILDLVSDIDFSGNIVAIRPYFSYFFRNNMSLGMRLGFTHGKANLGSFKVDIDEDINFDLNKIIYKSTNYSGSLLFTQYLGISRKGRFGVYNEVELAFSGGNNEFHRPYNGQMRITHTDTFKAALNFSPGVCVYILEPLSFNVSLGVFGLYVQNQKQKVDGENLGSRTNSGANFRFNIFNINFGIAVNI